MASPGNISTVAGTGIAGYSGDGGPAIYAQFENTELLATEPRYTEVLARIEEDDSLDRDFDELPMAEAD